MNETMGQIIKRLRKEHNLTQEELAEQLNISAPAVSKWENDTSMPDISQVVPLANLFGVPTDVLFGVYGADNDEDIKSRLDEIFRIYDNCKDGEEGPTAIIILDKYREAIRLYPNNPTIMLNAIAFAEMVVTCNEAELKELIGEEGIEELTNEMIRWAHLVIKYSTDISDILSAKRDLINIHVRRKDRESAYKLADTFPNDFHNIRGILMADLKYRAGDTDGQKKIHISNIQSLSEELFHQAVMLGNIYNNDGDFEDALYCYSFVRDMLGSIYRKEKYRPPFVYCDYPLYRFPAYCLTKLGRYNEAITLLEEGVLFITAQAENYNKKKELDIPLLRGYSFEYGFDGNAEYGDVTSRLKNLVLGDDFKPLADDPRYQAIVKKIEST